MAPAPLFQGTDLACIRGERAVFAQLSFGLEAGGALLVTGRNGAGKSSLLRVMAGLLAPAAGRLLWRGQAIDAGEQRHGARIGYVGHLDAVKPVLTVAENLSFWAALRGGTDMARALECFALAELAGLPGKLLSAGQKRRLALARLLVAPLPLWLLDEPTLGLDRTSIAALETAIAEHRAGGGAVVLSTHTAIALPDAISLDMDQFRAGP